MISLYIHSPWFGVALRDYDVFVEPILSSDADKCEMYSNECVIDSNDFPLKEGCNAYAFAY
jgi:hypothetical protein